MLTWTHNRIRRCHNLRITRSSFWDIHKPTYSISVVSRSSLNQDSADTNKSSDTSRLRFGLEHWLFKNHSQVSLHSMNLFLDQKVVRGWTSQHALETMTEDVENNDKLDRNGCISACYASKIKVCCTNYWNTNDSIELFYSHLWRTGYTV